MVTTSKNRNVEPARGFTYIGVLFAVVFLGVALAAIGQVWSTMSRRAKEEQLLYIGAEFGRALAGYRDATPSGQKPYPSKVEDLVRDPRFPDVRRYLRRPYADPLTGRFDWGYVREPGGGIVGIYSNASGEPLKTANFTRGLDLPAVRVYSGWVFRAPEETGASGLASPPSPAGTYTGAQGHPSGPKASP